MDDRIDMRIRTTAMEAAHRMAPWRPDIPWWAVGIQGVVGLLLGLWLLFNQGAGEPVVAALGVVLVVIAAAWAWSAMRSDLPQLVLGWRGLKAGVGGAVGLLVVVDAPLDFLTPPAALVVLSIGLVLVGVIGAAEWLAGRVRLGWRWPSLVGSAVATALGFIVLVSRLQAAPVFLQVIAMALVVAGVLLLVRAGLVLRQDQALRHAPTAAGGSTPPVPVAQASAGTAAPTVTVRSAGSGKPTDGTPGTGGSGTASGPSGG